MLSFTPSPKLEKALKAVQADITRLAGELARVSEAEATWLHRWALISTIGASTRIENAMLADAEIDWVDTALSQDGHVTAFEANKAAILDKLSRIVNAASKRLSAAVKSWELSIFKRPSCSR